MFSYEIYQTFKNTFSQNTSTLVAASGSKQCKPMNTCTTKLMLLRKKWYTWTVLLRLVFLDKEYSPKVFLTLLAVPNFSKVTVGEVFCEKGVLENFANHRCFSVNFARFSRTPLLVCTRMPSICHSHVLVCNPYVTRMYSYVIRMSLVCTHISSVCHSYVLVCHRMWFYHEPSPETAFNYNLQIVYSFRLWWCWL